MVNSAEVHRAAIALGSNLGDSAAILQAATQRLAMTPGITLKAASPLYRTKPVGPPQPDYLNACVIISSNLMPQPLMKALLDIELEFGRVRHDRWGPRLLDLDLLLYDHQVLDQPNLQIPHPRLHERAFVLVPLADIAADWVEPVSGQSIAQLVQQVDRSGVDRIC